MDNADTEFLRSIRWASRAPNSLVKAARKGRLEKFVIAARARLEPAAARFRRHLAEPTLIRTAFGLRTVLPRTRNQDLPRQQFLFHDDHGVGQDSIVAEVDKDPSMSRFEPVLRQWLRDFPTTGITNPLELLLAFEVLLNPPLEVLPETWFRLWQSALTGFLNCREQSEQTQEWMSGIEVPLAGGVLFSAVKGSRTLRKSATRRLRRAVCEQTCEDGTPRSGLLTALDSWFGVLTRASWWSHSFEYRTFSAQSAQRFRSLTARAAELSRGDGGFAFSDQSIAAALLPLAARVSGWSGKSPIGRYVRSIAGKRARGGSRRPETNRRPGRQSDEAGTAWMRNRLTVDADAITVDYDGVMPVLELTALGTPIISGVWEIEISFAGVPVATPADWTCTCWFSDKDGDYLELQGIGQGVCVDRQLLLSRHDHFAVMQDSVTTATETDLSVRTRLRLCQGVSSRADFITREWRLHTGLVPLRLFPVSLESDRVDHAAGELSVDGGAVSLRIDGHQRVAAPIVMDWHPDRRDRDADWTRLTVTESRRLLSPAEAAAFRLRIGAHQIVSYRRLDSSRELRAVLGEHTGKESFVGKLTAQGKLDPLILVDA